MTDKAPCSFCGGVDVSSQALAPTIEAIEAWIAHRPIANGWPSWGVELRTKAGSWRMITGRVEYVNGHGPAAYWTIRGEGSSNGGRVTIVRADQIIQARGHVLHYAEMEARA